MLSGTSLALAVGCAGGEPAKAERLEPMGLAAIEQVEEAAQAARRRPRYEDETALASSVSPAEAPAAASGSDPWFLRPAGQAQPGFVSEQPTSVSNQGITQSSQVNVVPERPRPQPIVQPVRPRPPGWRRAACGRG